MTTNDDAAVKREWGAERSDGTQYTLTIERAGEHVTVSYETPPEYHYQLSNHCSLAEFLDGKIDASLIFFSESQLSDAREFARGLLRRR